MRLPKVLEISFSCFNSRQKEGPVLYKGGDSNTPEHLHITQEERTKFPADPWISCLFCNWLLTANFFTLDCSPPITQFPVLRAKSSQWRGIKPLALFLVCRSITCRAVVPPEEFLGTPFSCSCWTLCCRTHSTAWVAQREQAWLPARHRHLCVSRTSWNAKNKTLPAPMRASGNGLSLCEHRDHQNSSRHTSGSCTAPPLSHHRTAAEASRPFLVLLAELMNKRILRACSMFHFCTTWEPHTWSTYGSLPSTTIFIREVKPSKISFQNTGGMTCFQMN